MNANPNMTSISAMPRSRRLLCFETISFASNHTSAGRSFSAGADLGWMQRMATYDYEHNLADARLLAEMLASLYRLPQPTIARVQGAAS